MEYLWYRLLAGDQITDKWTAYLSRQRYCVQSREQTAAVVMCRVTRVTWSTAPSENTRAGPQVVVGERSPKCNGHIHDTHTTTHTRTHTRIRTYMHAYIYTCRHLYVCKSLYPNINLGQTAARMYSSPCRDVRSGSRSTVPWWACLNLQWIWACSYFSPAHPSPITVNRWILYITSIRVHSCQHLVLEVVWGGGTIMYQLFFQHVGSPYSLTVHIFTRQC